MSSAASQEPAQASKSNGSNSNSGSSSPSPSNSISLIRLDELSSFGATKQKRLPVLIKLNPLADQQQQQQEQQAPQATSMPDFSGSQMEKMVATPPQQQAESLPAGLLARLDDKENTNTNTQAQSKPNNLNESDDFQVVDMEDEELTTAASAAGELMGPSLPAPKETTTTTTAPTTTTTGATDSTRPHVSAAQMLERSGVKSLSAQLQSGQYASHLGDSLIEMIINLRNDNQNMVRALETNNEYVRERLSEFKRYQEESRKRELQFALEKADFEHRERKLQRQNGLLSERLKSLECKLRELNVEVGVSLAAASSSKTSSIRGDAELYPQLELLDNAAASESQQQQQQQQQVTMQMDATSGELHHGQPGGRAPDDNETHEQSTGAPIEAQRVAEMGRDQLNQRFDADKAQFYALDDPMKQCDQLERQLNDIGRRDYEICLLQQQLNIYRQDFRLERMAKLEAKIQIEKLKNDIDRLCLERVQEQSRGEQQRPHEKKSAVRFGPTTTTTTTTSNVGGEANLIGKLGHHLGKKAVRSAAKAAKYAAKQAHLEEKAAAAMARAAAAKAAASSHFTTPKAPDVGPPQSEQAPGADGAGQHQAHQNHHHHRGHHRHSSHGRPPGATRGGIRSEVMNDLLSTANKAMLTGYKMASTHVNLALDKLSQYEQQQASQLDPNSKTPIQQQQKHAAPSAPPMEPPSID